MRPADESLFDLDVPVGKLDSNPDGNPDTTDKNVLEEQDAELQKVRIARLKENTEHRRNLVGWVKELIPAYLVCVLAVVFLSGFECFPLAVSDTVLVALLSTTTANVLGLAAIVLRGLFK